MSLINIRTQPTQQFKLVYRTGADLERLYRQWRGRDDRLNWEMFSPALGSDLVRHKDCEALIQGKDISLPRDCTSIAIQEQDLGICKDHPWTTIGYYYIADDKIDRRTAVAKAREVLPPSSLNRTELFDFCYGERYILTKGMLTMLASCPCKVMGIISSNVAFALQNVPIETPAPQRPERPVLRLRS